MVSGSGTARQKWIELTHHVFADAKPSMVAPLPRADERYPSFWLGWRDLHHRKTKTPMAYWRISGDEVLLATFLLDCGTISPTRSRHGNAVD